MPTPDKADLIEQMLSAERLRRSENGATDPAGATPLAKGAPESAPDSSSELASLRSLLQTTEAERDKLLVDWREQDEILQEIAGHVYDEHITGPSDVLREIKRHISELEAERDSLKRKNDTLRNAWEVEQADRQAAIGARDAAESRLTSLTQAQQRLIEQSGRPVIQPWVCRLPLRMQSTMLLSMRGPDGCGKHNTAKALLRQLRAVVLVPAFPGRPDSFMGDQRGYEEWSVAADFLDSHDEYPHHWLMHFIHAAEIVGQFHTDDAIRGFWWTFYVAACEAFHMTNENIDALSRRLADPVCADDLARLGQASEATDGAASETTETP